MASPTEIPTADPDATYSYEALEGTWCGSYNEGLWLRLEFTKERVKPGEELGFAWDYHRNGALACSGPLSGYRSDPPLYLTWLPVTQSECPDRFFRFEHRPADGELDVSYSGPDGGFFSQMTTVDRNNCETEGA